MALCLSLSLSGLQRAQEVVPGTALSLDSHLKPPKALSDPYSAAEAPPTGSLQRPEGIMSNAKHKNVASRQVLHFLTPQARPGFHVRESRHRKTTGIVATPLSPSQRRHVACETDVACRAIYDRCPTSISLHGLHRFGDRSDRLLALSLSNALVLATIDGADCFYSFVKSQ